ncbi:hypothetical protein GH733_014518, partial [Mirounga leonina]
MFPSTWGPTSHSCSQQGLCDSYMRSYTLPKSPAMGLIYPKHSIQPTLSPDAITELQKGSNCCSCPKGWIGYHCNCYFFSGELKTWKES